MRLLSLICSFVVTFVVLCVQTAHASESVLLGTARNSKGEIVYLEKHIVKSDENGLNRFIRVEYSKPDGKLFATMTSDFSKSKLVPETVFEDKRFETKHILSIESENRVQFTYFEKDKKVSEKTLSMEEGMVASQGFDNFVKLNFSKLYEESVPFRFGVLPELGFYSLKGYSKKTEDEKRARFGIAASNFLLRIFAGELAVEYDKISKKLLSFSGRSNILDDSGKTQNVMITYKWEPST